MGITSSLWNYPVYVKGSNPTTIGTLLFGLTLVVLGYYLSKLISRFIGTKILPKVVPFEQGTVAVLENFLFYLLLIFSTVIGLSFAHVPFSVFTIMGGAMAIAVGFGSQALLSNFISGIILQIERPIQVGDTIEMDAVPNNPTRGVVERIGARSTVIRAINNTHIVVPNSQFLDRRVINWTLFDNKVQSEIKIIVPATADANHLSIKLESLLSLDDRILKSPSPMIMFTDFFETGAVALTVNIWIRLMDISSKLEIDAEVRKFAYKHFVMRPEMPFFVIKQEERV